MFCLKKSLMMVFVVVFSIVACDTEKTPAIIATSEVNSSSKIKEEVGNNKDKQLAVSPEGCITPPETFAYSRTPEDGMLPFAVTLPSGEWQVETTLLEEPGHTGIMASRTRNGRIELWILSQLSTQPTERAVYAFTIYYPESKTWKTVPVEMEYGGITVHIEKLFVTQDGSIFGLPLSVDQKKTPDIPFLSKYNEETEVFEFVRGAEIIPAASAGADGYPLSSKVVLDTKGNTFWVLVPDDAVYSYDPVKQVSQKHEALPDTDKTDLGDAVFSADGNIYYLSNEGMVFTNNDLWLNRFDLTTQSFEKRPLGLEPWPPAYTIFGDHAGRLWFSALGWKEPDGRWYQLLRSPIFVTNILWSGMEYRWKSPKILMESSDHRLWFYSYENGMVWLDPEKETWCWFTTYNSNIVEDQQHRLWMIADGKLFKNQLHP